MNETERRASFAQAHASSRLEGHQPAPEFLADCEAVIAGTMSTDEAIAASMKRALAADRVAAGVTGDRCAESSTGAV